MAKRKLLNKPRPPDSVIPSKAERLTAELELVEAEEAYAAAKAAGLERIATERATAFDKADSWLQYQRAVEKIAPAVPAASSDKLRELRFNYRTDWRKPVAPGEGAAPGTHVVGGEVHEPG